MKRITLLLCCLTLAACDDIFEEDISDRRVEAISPADGVHLLPGECHFRWQTLEDADGYLLTVVSPSFARAERLIVDTMMLDTLGAAHRFGCKVLLTEGEYQWSLRAFNSGYESKAEVRTLYVDAAEPEPAPEPEEP